VLINFINLNIFSSSSFGSDPIGTQIDKSGEVGEGVVLILCLRRSGLFIYAFLAATQFNQLKLSGEIVIFAQTAERLKKMLRHGVLGLRACADMTFYFAHLLLSLSFLSRIFIVLWAKCTATAPCLLKILK
jgi:hypothetical protein